MKDQIVEEVRKIRKEIELEYNADWDQIENRLSDIQKRHKEKLYKGNPKSLSNHYVA